MRRAIVEFIIGLQCIAIAVAIGDPPGDDPAVVSFVLVNLIVIGIALLLLALFTVIDKSDL